MKKTVTQGDFGQAVAVIVKYLNENYNPHTKVIIEPDHMEIVETTLGMPMRGAALPDEL